MVYIDGDHCFEPTLWDLSHWFYHTKPDGIIFIDDYASSDHPRVTAAVNKFIEIHGQHIEKMGYRCYDMYTGTGRKQIPVSKANACFQPKKEIKDSDIKEKLQIVNDFIASELKRKVLPMKQLEERLKNKDIDALLNSLSWKVTSPLRAIIST